MTDAVKKVLTEQIWYLATYSDEPNAVPVGFKVVAPDGKLVIGDCMMETTKNNVLKTGKAAVSVCDLATKEGYQIKGAAEYVTEGPVIDMLNKISKEQLGGRLVPKGAVVITPERVIVTTPGPDNKKEI